MHTVTQQPTHQLLHLFALFNHNLLVVMVYPLIQCRKILLLTLSRIDFRWYSMCFCFRHSASTSVKDHTADGVVTDTRSFSQEMGDGSLTGHVGTALYVAPELTASGSKEVYNQVRKAYSFAVASHLTRSQNVSLSLRGIFCETFFSFIFYSLPQVQCTLYGLTSIHFSSLHLTSVFEFLGILRGVAVDSALLGYNMGVPGDNWILMF